MSSAPTGDSNALPAVPVTTNVDGSDVNKGSNGDSSLVKAAEESKSAESAKPEVTVADKANGDSGAGDKREHPLASVSAENEKPETLGTKEEPAVKKQKTQNGVAKEIGSVPTSSGEKKKGGRVKKAKDAVKRAIPTDGIGSRTRSRTKTTS